MITTTDKQLATQIRDALNNTKVKDTCRVAMKSLNATQSESKANRLAGQAMAFMRMSEAYGIPPQDVFTIVDNVSKAALEEGRPEVRGLLDYFKYAK